jgi:hypothetical protein
MLLLAGCGGGRRRRGPQIAPLAALEELEDIGRPENPTRPRRGNAAKREVILGPRPESPADEPNRQVD